MKTTVTLFRPPEISRKPWRLPADMYNVMTLIRAQRLRKGEQAAFVPIREMQFLAVLDQDEVLFVDGAGGYMVTDGQAGRPIKLALSRFARGEREDLSAPVDCEVIFYSPQAEAHFQRILSIFAPALARYREVQSGSVIGDAVPQQAKVLPLARPVIEG